MDSEFGQKWYDFCESNDLSDTFLANELRVGWELLRNSCSGPQIFALQVIVATTFDFLMSQSSFRDEVVCEVIRNIQTPENIANPVVRRALSNLDFKVPLTAAQAEALVNWIQSESANEFEPRGTTFVIRLLRYLVGECREPDDELLGLFREFAVLMRTAFKG